MAERWALNPLVQLHWRQIDGEWLLYEDRAGATHMIDHLGAAVLTCFEARVPLAMTDLLAQLGTEFALDVAPDQAATVVQQFCALGLLLRTDQTTALHAVA